VKRKMLLADDSVTIQRVVELTFSGEDIDVVTVSDGEQAIARITAEAPDIVLADIAMPKKNGYEVAAFMKEHPTLANVPVLLLAGAFEPVDEELARRVKCDGVLVKPFETHEVIARVRELIEGKPREQAAAPPPAAPQAAPALVLPAPAAAAPAAPMPAAAAPPAPPPAAAAASAPAPVRDVPHTPHAAPPEESLDAYFDRLDVAFAARAQSAPRPFPHLAPPAAERIDTSAQPVTESGTAPDGRRVIADLFHALFEVEQGDREASSVRIPEQIERIRRRNTIE
jgi:CheY-like chemotaxis protein